MMRIALNIIEINVQNVTIDTSWMWKVSVNRYNNNAKDIIKKQENVIDAIMDMYSEMQNV